MVRFLNGNLFLYENGSDRGKLINIIKLFEKIFRLKILLRFT